MPCDAVLNLSFRNRRHIGNRFYIIVPSNPDVPMSGLETTVSPERVANEIPKPLLQTLQRVLLRVNLCSHTCVLDYLLPEPSHQSPRRTLIQEDPHVEASPRLTPRDKVRPIEAYLIEFRRYLQRFLSDVRILPVVVIEIEARTENRIVWAGKVETEARLTFEVRFCQLLCGQRHLQRTRLERAAFGLIGYEVLPPLEPL